MNRNDRNNFFQALDTCASQINTHLHSQQYISRFHPEDISEAVTLYTRSGGKRLRPAILLWSCGALGGDPEKAIPAAAAVEVFHTWTLVHDDIIDRDDLRRGSQTVHERFRHQHDKQMRLSLEQAIHYGVSVAILAGDVQHGWGISMMTELTTRNHIDPNITLTLINDLDTEVLNLLVEGEILDIQYSHLPFSLTSVKEIEDMLWKKTGVLYRFCARAGALISLGHDQKEHPYTKALEDFASLCGIAFQLQDDVLGILGDESKLGKPVGSDIREGKRTTVVQYAYEKATPAERNMLEKILGEDHATEDEIREIVGILEERGGIEKTKTRAKEHIEKALERLQIIPGNKYRDLLLSWAKYMISRNH